MFFRLKFEVLENGARNGSKAALGLQMIGSGPQCTGRAGTTKRAILSILSSNLKLCESAVGSTRPEARGLGGF